MNPDNDRIEIRPRAGGGWDWHRLDANGQQVCSSSNQGYADVDECWDAARSLNAPSTIPITVT